MQDRSSSLNPITGVSNRSDFPVVSSFSIVHNNSNQQKAEEIKVAAEIKNNFASSMQGLAFYPSCYLIVQGLTQLKSNKNAIAAITGTSKKLAQKASLTTNAIPALITLGGTLPNYFHHLGIGLDTVKGFYQGIPEDNKVKFRNYSILFFNILGIGAWGYLQHLSNSTDEFSTPYSSSKDMPDPLVSALTFFAIPGMLGNYGSHFVGGVNDLLVLMRKIAHRCGLMANSARTLTPQEISRVIGVILGISMMITAQCQDEKDILSSASIPLVSKELASKANIWFHRIMMSILTPGQMGNWYWHVPALFEGSIDLIKSPSQVIKSIFIPGDKEEKALKSVSWKLLGLIAIGVFIALLADFSKSEPFSFTAYNSSEKFNDFLLIPLMLLAFVGAMMNYGGHVTFGAKNGLAVLPKMLYTAAKSRYSLLFHQDFKPESIPGKPNLNDPLLQGGNDPNGNLAASLV